MNAVPIVPIGSPEVRGDLEATGTVETETRGVCPKPADTLGRARTDPADARRKARLAAYKGDLRAEIARRCRLLDCAVPLYLGRWNAAALIELVIDLRRRCDRLSRGLMRAPRADRAAQ